MPGGTTRLFADDKFYTKSGRAHMVAVKPRLPARDGEYPFVLNTGRIRDQWHTMTRTGNVPRLNAQRPETFVEVCPCDAAGMADGSLARISSRFGSMLVRVQFSSDQCKESLFVPMHWSDVYAPSAMVASTQNSKKRTVQKASSTTFPENLHGPVRPIKGRSRFLRLNGFFLDWPDGPVLGLTRPSGAIWYCWQ